MTERCCKADSTTTFTRRRRPGVVYYYDHIGMHHRYEEPTPLAWTITAGHGYRGRLRLPAGHYRFGGRQWEAWFTREVPVAATGRINSTACRVLS
ncbi:MAG: hypothetical protein WKG07_36215 [Hymenobacter sp.]